MNAIKNHMTLTEQYITNHQLDNRFVIALYPLIAMSSLPLPSEKMFLEKALRDNEDELVSSMTKGSIQELCDKFFEGSLLSSESHAHFTSLDHSRLKPQLQVRYLVRLASERVKTDPALGHNLIEVLDTLEGVPSSLTDKLKQAMADTNERPTDDSDTERGLSATAVGEACDIVLTPEDVSLLTELLAQVSHKWVEIAISLNLRKNERADCEGKTNIISLSQCIEFWISNNSNATLKKLRNVLSSDTVGEKILSIEIGNIVLEAKQTKRNQKEKISHDGSKSSKSSLTPRIVNQSLPIEAADGKSTLLQVQVRPRESVVSYQWNKDGQPLANTNRYSGVDEDILVVRHASQGTEGKYTCCVSLQDRQVTSNPITLTVHFSPAKNLILNRYSILKEVPTSKNDWPPVVANAFINLALAKSSSNKKNNTSLSVEGGADKIIAEKKKIEYDEVFGEYKSDELILVEGRPGSGKTTLVHKVIKDWASGKALAKSKLTLLLTLRLLNDSQDETLEKVLQTLYSDEDAIILPDIRDGEGVCFVLDGLDEYQPQNREKSVILKLLDRKCFAKSMIFVFTRPSATEQLSKDRISKTIEVFGFKKQQIFEYIDSFPFDEEGGTSDSSITRASQLKDYLLSHPNIHDMCYLPIHAAMICFLFQFAENVSATQTKVYEEFTRLIIQRHLARYENGKALYSLKELDGEYEKHFKDLCRLAYEMTINTKQVISEKELQVQLGGSGSFSEEGGLGLLTICPTLYQTGVHQSYSFLHLTFQEFLTAYYIANYMEVFPQLNLLEKYSEMKTVWLFYSGLADLEKSPKILELFRHNVIELCRYALESQRKTLSDKILKDKSGQLIFYDQLTPTDLLSIEYVIATSSLPITEIQIRNYDRDNRMGALLQELQNANVQQLHALDIGKISDEETNTLCEVLQTATNITMLYLNIKHTRSCCAKELALQINHCTKLFSLRLSYSGTPACIQTFVSSLSPSISWHWYLSFVKLDSESIHALGNGLQHLHINRLSLTVTESDINEDGMTCLVDGLQNIKSLRLVMSRNNINSSVITPLLERLNTLTLSLLDLSHINIGPDGATALAGGIKGLTKLYNLDLSHNNIGPDGATALAGGIKSLTKLYNLDLSHNNIGPDGATALAGGIKGLTKLQLLYLSHNNIGPDGATALAGGLQYLTELNACDLSHNNIDVAAAKAVVTLLKKCGHLYQLIVNESNKD